ncbi:MAG: HK97 gp10 family phage protein [Nitrososphaerota archaeon]
MIRVFLPDRLEKAGWEVLGQVSKLMGSMAVRVEAAARELCPVRTGRLRASIKAGREGPLRYVVEASAPYAGYVEFGTSRMPPKPFMGPAISIALAAE